MTTISRSIGKAMTAQLDRVNGKTYDQHGNPVQIFDPVAAENLRLQNALQEAQVRIAELEEQLATANQQLRADSPIFRAERTHNGRPVISLAEAARRAGMKYHTARRCVISKWWDAAQDSSLQWLVYADQPLTPKPRK